MPSLQVRELPENIYSLLQEKAKKEHRSLAQEAVVTLAKGLDVSLSLKNRRMELLKQITTNPPLDQLALDLVPVDLLREDRER
ncbi:MAG: hypothetical protein KKB30_14190 [Proteobacteria bacterium]|nr:hypothetical protein [Pseudomonadota bacterium]MBU1716001.1 hypothetical protein [Pseudomonadota bacterium]